MLCVSESTWGDEEPLEFMDFDGFIYSSREDIFKHFCFQKTFCDCEGNLFKVVGKIPPTEWWRKAFRFLPNVYREKLMYEPAGTMDVESLKRYLIDRVQELEQSEYLDEWLEAIKVATTHQAIIDA